MCELTPRNHPETTVALSDGRHRGSPLANQNGAANSAQAECKRLRRRKGASPRQDVDRNVGEALAGYVFQYPSIGAWPRIAVLKSWVFSRNTYVERYCAISGSPPRLSDRQRDRGGVVLQSRTAERVHLAEQAVEYGGGSKPGGPAHDVYQSLVAELRPVR